MAIAKDNEAKASDINNEIIAPLKALRHDHPFQDSSARIKQNSKNGSVVERESRDVGDTMRPYTPPNVNNVAAGSETNSQGAPKEIANLLDNLLNHVHVYMDDYGTACNCNCNCNCNCTRGIM
ncbi:hypothetical protein [Yersinia ruckeri]|uniref:hypothetical protein n=1 Tax=Yersinia ruckeri TaxID=29486 RepID=UPI002238160C|nr:hypothetical protein [Yersinia ruckeri]MCW6598670.1 hypothetical protein [Yersinia ruckeri]